MTSSEPRIIVASREVQAPPGRIFELIAEPTRQPEWDGNDNLAECPSGQRVRAVGDVFSMTLTMGAVRENHVVEFTEGERIAWRPAKPGRAPVGHLWRWQIERLDTDRSLVTHTYDWTDLHDETRFPRARATTTERLAAPIDRLATLAETRLS
ncbi:MAG: polyketide cyclase [Actinomycetota bacterium]|nr:polyketide cyclase [Actinomycetota bacterium]